MSQLRIQIEEASQRAASFLKQRLRDGKYSLSCHDSDGELRPSHLKGHLFSSFFITEALGEQLDEVERSIILTRLMSEEYEGLWGYCSRAYFKGAQNDPHFVDADDTAFALRTFRLLDVYRDPERLLEFLPPSRSSLFCKATEPYGFVTFRKSPSPSFSCSPSVGNNFEIHPEVNANVYLTFLGTNLEHCINEDLIHQSQDSEGFFYSYFYPSKFFATYQFLDLLNRLNCSPGLQESAFHFLEKSQNPDGGWGEPSDPYSTALALRASFLKADQREYPLALDFLLESQDDDGSWHFGGVVWEFHGGIDDLWQARDCYRVITTSMSLAALKSYSSHLLE